MLTCRSSRIFIALFLASHCTWAQKQITSIITSTTTQPLVSYSNIKGAGLKTATNTLSSLWDSSGTNFTVNYNVTANNITSVRQLTVNGFPRAFITWPVNAFVKVRRRANTYVNNISNHHNFWSVCSSIPAIGAIAGTFNLNAPEIVLPEDALISGNINSGYDNIFQNTINNLHAGNIERLDYIIPQGLDPAVFDIGYSGVVAFDRGTGDPFKVAAILSLDINNVPLTYGPMVSVTAANFGPALLTSSFNYAIMTHDPAYGSSSRPTSNQNQNIRGVIMTLGDLGMTAHQVFYGYSLFGSDVVTVAADWNTYPNNSDAAAQFDPANVMKLFKDVNSLLPVPLSFKLSKQNNKLLLDFTIYDVVNGKFVAIERSINGVDFEEIGSQQIIQKGKYTYTDAAPLPGPSYYRLRLVEKTGVGGYSATRKIEIAVEGSLQLSPNPARNIININLPTSWRHGQITTSLFNTAGVMVQQNRFKIGGTKAKLSVDKIPAGTYYLHLVSDNNYQTVVRQVTICR